MRYVMGWGCVMVGLLVVGLLCSVSLDGERINLAWLPVGIGCLAIGALLIL